MHISLEKNEPNAIEGYSDNEVKINKDVYTTSLIVNSKTLIKDWPITALEQLNEENIQPIIQLKPKIIIIGYNQNKLYLNPKLHQALAHLKIGLEIMPLGAACRTYNVLLSEYRDVAFGIIFN